MRFSNCSQKLSKGLLFIPLIMASSAFSEDIEIYKAAIGATSTGTVNPNVLFIIDSSISMKNATAAVPVNGYDSTDDYGDNDDYIYVYDADLDWTNNYFTASQNRCEAAIDKFAATPELPIYQDRAMQWIEFEYYPDCGGGSVATAVDQSGEIDDGGSNDRISFSELDISDIEDGTTLTLTVENKGNGSDEIGYEIDYSSNNGSSWSDIPSCSNQTVDDGETESCTDISIPSNATHVRAQVYGENGDDVEYEATFYYFASGSGSGGGGSGTIELSGNVTKQSSSWDDTTDVQTLNTSDIAAGSTITFEVTNLQTNGRWIRYEVQSSDDGSDWDDIDSCEDNWLSDDETETCEVDFDDDVPSDAVQIRGRVYYNGNGGGSRSYESILTYTPISSGGSDDDDDDCDASELLTGAEWFLDFETDVSDTETILECEGDGGVHGNLDASTEDTGSTNQYITYCPDEEDDCTEPYYVSLAGSELDWTDQDIYKFVSGNYHNYLQSGGFSDTDELGSNYKGTQSSGYCDNGSNNREGHFYTDSEDGIVYECQLYIDVAKNAAKDVANQQTGVNVGAMRFNYTEGGYILNDIEDVSSNLEAFEDAIDSIAATDGTPLGETLYEAYLYFNGETPYYGDEKTSGGPSGFALDENAFISGNTSNDYESPIVNACQSNNIIFLSDGQPNNDGGHDNRIEALDGISECSDIDNSTISNAQASNHCIDELAEYMATTDMSSSVDGDQYVNSYFIGFNETLDIFQEAATKGNGQYYEASDYEELLNSFEEILVSIAVDKPTTLVAPAVSVNAFNELQHRDQIYYAIFEPSLQPRWQGNVKKFSINGDGQVLDRFGDEAVDSSTGFFMDESQSFWSDDEDGGEVDIGGFTEQLTETRNIYLDASAIGSGLGSGITQLGSSTSLNHGATDADSDEEADDIRDWLLGIDVLDQVPNGNRTEAHHFAGDPLHSKPFVITYSGTSTADSRDVLFVTTNLGMLHAIDARNNEGTELWAYMPGELMENPKDYMDNNTGADHTYGLDGEATVWTIEDTSSPTFALSSAYMYQGMRRGGSKYFAWDISNALSTSSTPISTMWKIPDDSSSDFTDLGQTWSKMIRTKMSWGCSSGGCTTKDVLVFSGGYDEYYDDDSNAPYTSSSAVKGNAVYIVDALNGPSTSNGGFVYKIGDGIGYDENLPIYNSIPGDPSPIDVDGDGDMDVLFFIDIAGHAWRVDFDEYEAITDADFTTGGMVADLYDGTDFRRFYNALDVSISTPQGDTPYFNLVVGSGYRAFPKADETWTNAIYVIHDENVSGPMLDDNTGEAIYTYKEEDDSSLSVLDLDDLYVWTSTTGADKSTNAPYGFYRELDGTNDEKILQPSVTFGGKILVSSYIPVGSVTVTCGSGLIGSGRTYLLDLFSGDGALEFDTDDDGDIDGDDNDTYIDLAHEGIPPEATILLVPELVVCVGTECMSDLLTLETGQASRTYWREE